MKRELSAIALTLLAVFVTGALVFNAPTAGAACLDATGVFGPAGTLVRCVLVSTVGIPGAAIVAIGCLVVALTLFGRIARALEETAPGVLRDAERAGQQVTVLSLDIDGLKRVNDTEGHAQGDKVLRVLAQALKAEIGTRGQLYRLGGDEFAVISAERADVLLAWVDIATRAARHTVLAPVGASVGVASSVEAGQAETLLRLADSRMYEMKRRRGDVWPTP